MVKRGRGKERKIKIYHNKKLLFIIILLVITLIVLIYFIRQKESNKENIDFVMCDTDLDCIKIQTTCCPCSASGEEICVSREESEDYFKNLSNCPERMICAQVENCKIKSCKCVSGECVGIEK